MPIITPGHVMTKVDVVKAALYEAGRPDLADLVKSYTENGSRKGTPGILTEHWVGKDCHQLVIQSFYWGHVAFGCDCKIESDGMAIMCKECFFCDE